MGVAQSMSGRWWEGPDRESLLSGFFHLIKASGRRKLYMNCDLALIEDVTIKLGYRVD